MKPETQNQDPSTPEINPEPEVLEFPFSNRHNGKVARRSKAVRDRINFMLLDGLTYPRIIELLGEDGKDLKPDNLSQHRKGAYQEWLQQREWLGSIAAKTEFSTDVLAQPESASLHEAGLRFAAAQLMDQLMRLAGPTSKNASTLPPETLARLVNALSRLTREALAFQKYRDDCAKAAAAELKRLDPKRELTDREDELITQRMDDFFLKPRRRRTGEATGEAQSPEGPKSNVQSPTSEAGSK